MSGQTMKSAAAVNSGQTAKRHLLLIRPVALTTDDAEAFVEPVIEITGLDAYSVRQKLVGSSLDILKIGDDAEELSRMRHMRDRLRSKGFDVALISADFRLHAALRVRAVQLEITSGGLTFLDTRNHPLTRLDSGAAPLVCIGSLDPTLYGSNKNLLKQLYGVALDDTETLLEKIEDISKTQPALAIFPANGATPFHIICGKFNFGSLGDRAKLAVSQNFLEIIKLLREKTQCNIIADFGAKALPIIPLAGKAQTKASVLKKFLFYSQLIKLAVDDGLQEVQTANKSTVAGAGIPVLGALASVPGLVNTAAAPLVGSLSGQELIPTQGAKPVAESKKKTSAPGIRVAESGLPLPPPCESFSGYSAKLAGFKSFYTKLQILGPPPLALALLVGSAIGFSQWFTEGAKLDLGWAVTPAGALLLLSALTMFQRKRMFENTPTSKLRSMQMGTVEIAGEAKRKYALRAPHSLVSCVYYRYKVLKKELRHSSKGVPTEQWVVVDRGNSGPVPFYLEDETGKALIDPEGAIISGLQTEEYCGSMADMFSGAAINTDRKVVESVIPEGASLYILGHARPIKNSARDRNEEYRKRLKALKSSPEAMARYDTDGDGNVSIEEWAQARADIENQLLAESLMADIKSDTAVVGKHPGRGLFFISDRAEPELLAIYRWMVPILGALGFATVTFGLMRLLG